MPNRRSIRLKGYDYTQPGAYFVTIVTHQRACLFGTIVDGEMQMNRCGDIIRQAWLDLPHHYPNVTLDAFVIMPNHVHGVIILIDLESKDALPEKICSAATTPVRHGLPEIVRALKSFSAQRINSLRRSPGMPIWQRNYFEHIIRNQPELDRIREYIFNNPGQWINDEENPVREGGS